MDLDVVDDKGNLIKQLIHRLLPLEIAIDAATNLEVDEPVVAGTKTITGTLTRMPSPPLKPVQASAGVDASYGNYPGITVSVMDPLSGEWSQVVPAVAANPLQFLSVNSDGSFSAALPSALTNGQKVKIAVVPPPGRSFVVAHSPTTPFSIKPHEITVLTDVALLSPTISSTPFNEGTTVISGTATIPPSGVKISVAVVRLRNRTAREVPEGVDDCLYLDKLDKEHLKGLEILPLVSSSSNQLLGTVDPDAGTYKVTLAEALKQDEWIQVVQVLPAAAVLPAQDKPRCGSAPRQVRYPFEFHRTNLTFVAGVLISNSSSSSTSNANFSQANQFYSFNADHAWRLPGADCVALNAKEVEKRMAYLRMEIASHLGSDIDLDKARQRIEYQHCGEGRRATPGWHSNPIFPGFNTFFESRLTSIPVSTSSATVTAGTTTTTPTAGTTASIFSPQADATTSTSSTTTSPTLLTSQKVFKVETGVFLPWVLTHGAGHHPNGLFIGPLAKAGFDTVTGAGVSNNVILPGGGTGSLDFQTAYKFYSYGARLGNMSLSQSSERAPLIEHYLDVTFGRYSNLQSYICHPADVTTARPAGAADVQNCVDDYPLADATKTYVNSRKQLYRLDFEGLVRIPVPLTAIPFYIGFNANIAQHSWQAEKLNHGYAPPDDIRILFGTKIDMGTLLSTLKLGTN